MKQLLTKKIGLLVMMLLATFVNSFAFEVNGLTYRVVDNDAKTVKVSYQGSDAWTNSYTQSSIVIPETVEFNGSTYTVVEIGEQAFTSAAMSSVTIPATVKTIGNYAFQNCKYLTTIDLSSVETFGFYIMSDCYALTSVQLPKTMQSIPQGLLSRCTSITSFTFPDGVTSIEYDAFNGTGLTSIDIPESVTSIRAHAFANTALTSITTSVSAIDEGAFENCTSLTNVTLYASYITKMGPSNSIFLGCNNIKKIICLARNDVSIFGFSDDVKEIAMVIVPESQVTTWKNNGFLNVKAADITNVGGHVVDVLDDGMAATGGAVTVNGKMADSMFGQAFVIEADKDVELEFIPNDNYGKLMELDKVTINGIDVTASLVNGKYTIKSISGNQLIKATWKEGVSYNVTYSANDFSCGSLYVNGKELSMYSNTSAFPANKDITLVIKPNTGYSISYFRIGMMDKKNELTANTDGTYSYTYNLSSDTSIEIGYEKPWKLTTTFGDGGTVTIDGKSVTSGTTKELTDAKVEVCIKPNTGYELASVLYNGTDVTTTGVLYTGMDGLPHICLESYQGDNQTLDITFQKINTTYTISYYIDGEVYKEVSYNVGDAVTPEPAPTKDGYTFSGWSTIPSTMPANNVVVTGSFTKNGGGDEPAEHEYVDLGLPSGTLWATMNIGASVVEDSGDKFAWGETTSRTDYKKENYIYYSDTFTATKYNGSDGLTELQNGDDAAYVNWGAKWRTPTKEDWLELQSSCSLSWTSLNGVNGYMVKSNSNGNTIFLPVLKDYPAGRYWSSTRGQGDWGAYDVAFDGGGFYIDDDVCETEGRHMGENVRPVRKEVTSGNIDFADANVKVILLAGSSIDTNGDGEISYEEAAAVTSIGIIFQQQKIVSFDELQYFTGLTSIDYDAFKGCSSLIKITIPNSVTSIGGGAFYECSSLRLVTSKISNPFEVWAFDWSSTNATLIVPKGSRSAYKNVNGWTFGNILEEGETSYEIEKTDDQGVRYSLRQADDNSFYYAVTGYTEGLKPEIVIPADIDGCPVKTIEYNDMAKGAFNYCSTLISVTLGSQLTTIGDMAFCGCTNLATVKIGKNVTRIEDYAFYNCNSLETVVLPKKLESIGSYAFSGEWSSSDYSNHGCPFTSISIPGSVKTIGNEAFRYCRELASVTFETDDDANNNLTNIGAYAFSECSFTSITIPNSVTTIGGGAFANNYKLATAILGDAVTEIKDETFYNCGALTFVTIPDGVTSIGVNAFKWCSQLSSVRMPQSLTTMAENVFDGCPIKSIDLPDAFTAIPANLFKNNDLEYIKLGNNVKSIGKNAFGSQLMGEETNVVIEIATSTPPSIAKDAFPNIDLTVINVIVPDAAAEADYKNVAVWREMTYANMETDVEVTVDVPGDLGNEVREKCRISAPKVVGLKVKGAINADDFMQLRSNFKSLLRLDLSECDITEIPDGAMKGKTQLQKLTLPTKLQTIGRSAFQGCPYLTGKLDLPAGVTSIGNSAFEGTYYTSVALPRSLKSIGDSAFYKLPIKQKLMIPDGMTSIGAYAFADTYIYDHLTIPDGVEKLGDGAFRNTQITSMFLPTGITSLNWSVFQGCSNLDEALYIPDNVTSMYGYAFDGCSALKNIRLSANLTSMGEYALQNTNVEYIKVPSKVKVLSQGVLKNSKSLESLALPAYLKTVGAEALYGCSGLRNLSIDAIEPPTAERTSFIGVNTDLCLISIPTESYRKYVRAEYWGQFVEMRNDISVETEGNGQIAFEAVVEGEEEASMARAKARVQRFTAARRANTRGASGETESELAYANNGSSVYVPKNGQVNFLIIPAEGEMLVSAFLDGEDITSSIVDGVYTATADKEDAKLVVKFSGESQEEGETEFIRISAAGQVPFCSSFDLDFTDKPELKAYVATGYDKAKGTIWLTRVKQVPAETGFLLIGAAGDYNIPISLSAADVYYKNMFKGTLEGTTIYENEWTDRGYTNYYLSKGTSGVGFYKVTNPAGQAIGANRAYLPIPMDIWANGGEGSTETITVSAAKQVPYYTNPWSALDFTSLEAQGVKAYTATGYNYKTGTIWLSRVKKVPSNTGILVMAEEAGEYEVPTVQVELYYENMFRGSETAQTIYTNETIDGVDYVNYYLSKGTAGVGFYKVTDEAGVKMGANRCYLPIPKRDSASGARGKNAEDSFCNMVFSDNDDDVIAIPVFGGMNGEDDGATGISTQFQDAEPDAYYNLQGQRVENPGKGVFIKNGRKVVIK